MLANVDEEEGAGNPLKLADIFPDINFPMFINWSLIQPSMHARIMISSWENDLDVWKYFQGLFLFRRCTISSDNRLKVTRGLNRNCRAFPQIEAYQIQNNKLSFIAWLHQIATQMLWYNLKKKGVLGCGYAPCMIIIAFLCFAQLALKHSYSANAQ